jgi:hypothetical protein
MKVLKSYDYLGVPHMSGFCAQHQTGAGAGMLHMCCRPYGDDWKAGYKRLKLPRGTNETSVVMEDSKRPLHADAGVLAAMASVRGSALATAAAAPQV